MRVFAASLSCETNTFSPIPTGLASFRERAYFPAGTHPQQMLHCSGPLWAARQRADEWGWTLVEGLVASAMPGGTTTRMAYETLRDELLSDLQAALPVNIVLLGLHGAMVADGYDDCEGDLLTRVREMVGPGVVIGAELDPHCHLSETMTQQADILICFKEYPHTDVLERAQELLELCRAAAMGWVKPLASVVDCRMIAVLHTSREPMRGFVDRLQALEGRQGILSISIVHGFPWGDVADMGTQVLVYSDNDRQRGDDLARALADELWGLREQLRLEYPGIDAALDEAVACPAAPVVLADSADNAGGGAPGDSTFILRRLLERKIDSAALGPLCDPTAVRLAFAAGAGARLPLRIGGKVGPVSGDPLDALCTVKAVHPAMMMSGLAGTSTPLGDCALVEVQGVEVVLSSVRCPGLDIDLFTQLGCDPARKKIVVVKSSQHFYASFSKIAAKVIYVDTPGALCTDLAWLPYQKIHRPKWPL
ncbi:MAG: M81 family metallopeptidase [Sterolibacterium sp.]|jgi:microcystin degradation protein MlrC